jgi:hypothetical protein
MAIKGRTVGGDISKQDEDFFKVQQGVDFLKSAQQALQARASAGDSDATAVLASIGSGLGQIFGHAIGGAEVGSALGQALAPENYNKLRIVAPKIINALKAYYIKSSQAFLPKYGPQNTGLLNVGNRYVTDLNTADIPTSHVMRESKTEWGPKGEEEQAPGERWSNHRQSIQCLYLIQHSHLAAAFLIQPTGRNSSQL